MDEIKTLELDTEKRILIINGKKVEEPIVVCTPGPEGWMNSVLLNYEQLEPGQNPISAKRLVISLEVFNSEGDKKTLTPEQKNWRNCY